MRIRHTPALLLAVSSLACTTTPAPVAEEPPPVTAPTTQAELEQLRAENRRLREQVYGARRQAAKAESRAASVEAKQAAVTRGKLERGMTVQEAMRAVNGETSLRGDLVTLESQTATRWVYLIRSGATPFGPGSGGSAPLGTNMRGTPTTPVQIWRCTFDAATGTLDTFELAPG